MKRGRSDTSDIIEIHPIEAVKRKWYARRRQRAVFDYDLPTSEVKSHAEFKDFMLRHTREHPIPFDSVKDFLEAARIGSGRGVKARYEPKYGTPLDILGEWTNLLNKYIITHSNPGNNYSIIAHNIVDSRIEPEDFKAFNRVVVIAYGLVDDTPHSLVLVFDRDEKTCFVLDPSRRIRNDAELSSYLMAGCEALNHDRQYDDNVLALPFIEQEDHTGTTWTNVLYPNVGRMHDVDERVCTGDCGLLTMFFAFWVCYKPDRKSLIPPPLPFHESLSMREWVMQCIYKGEITVPKQIEHYMHITGGRKLRKNCSTD